MIKKLLFVFIIFVLFVAPISAENIEDRAVLSWCEKCQKRTQHNQYIEEKNAHDELFTCMHGKVGYYDRYRVKEIVQVDQCLNCGHKTERVLESKHDFIRCEKG